MMSEIPILECPLQDWAARKDEILCVTGREGFMDAQALVPWLLQHLDAPQHSCTVKACLMTLLQLCIKACPHSNALAMQRSVFQPCRPEKT